MAIRLNGDVVKAIDRTQIELYSGLLGLIANISINMVLIPRYGISGAAAGTALGYMIYNFIEVIWIKRAAKVTPFSPDIVKVVCFMFLAAASISILLSERIGIVGLIGVGGLMFLVEPLALVLTKSVNESDVELVRSIEEKLGRDLQIVILILQKGL